MPDSLNDRIADEHRGHVVDLLRFEPTLRRRVLALLDSLESQIVDRLVRADIDGGITSFTRARLNALLKVTRETIRTAYASSSDLVDAEMRELADVESGFAGRTINRLSGVELVTVGFTETQLRAIVSDSLIEGAPSREWWSRQAGDLLQRFGDEMRQGMVAGEGVGDLVRRVRGTRSAGYRDGIMFVSRRYAESLVRSSVMAVSNRAYLETWRDNADVIKALVHVSTLDLRTTLICIARSGKQWTLDGKPIGGHNLPFKPCPCHWRCRSILAPVTKSFRELGLDRDEVPEGTRSSMDGQVPEELDFAAWLATKSEEDQNELLGKGRAELWRQGKITFAQLLDQTGRPLTLAELRRRSRR